MQAEYGIDLGEAVFGAKPMGMRRLWVLIEGLPPDSALAWSTDAESVTWNLPNTLLGTIVEILGNVYRREGSQPIMILPRRRTAKQQVRAAFPVEGDIIVDSRRVVESEEPRPALDTSALPPGPYRRQDGGGLVPGILPRFRGGPRGFKTGHPGGPAGAAGALPDGGDS